MAEVTHASNGARMKLEWSEILDSRSEPFELLQLLQLFQLPSTSEPIARSICSCM